MVKNSNAFIFLMFIIFSACRPDTPRDTLIIDGVLLAGDPPEVRIYRMQDMNKFPLDEAEVTIELIGGETAPMFPLGDDAFTFGTENPEFMIAHGVAYQVKVVWKGKEASATAEVPSAIELVQVSATDIPINTSSTGQPTFSVLWSPSPEHAHVLTLTPLEDDPVPIPFSVPSGNFANQYRFPVPGQGTTMLDTDFAFYGEHRLRIYAIPKNYESLYFYQPTEGGDQLTGGPSNVVGGAGFLSASAYTDITLNLLP